jgi:hypothetical protein
MNGPFMHNCNCKVYSMLQCGYSTLFRPINACVSLRVKYVRMCVFVHVCVYVLKNALMHMCEGLMM